MQAKLAAQSNSGAPSADPLDLFCDVLSKIVRSWNLTDDEGAPIETTADASADVDMAVLTLVMQKIGEQTQADPLNGGGSRNGSLPTDDSEPLLSITGS